MSKITYEIRKNDLLGPNGLRKDELDEVLIYVDGECIFHMEAMSDQHWWMGIYPENRKMVHVNLSTKKARIFASVMEE